MTNSLLSGLDITNFRSIRGHIHAPLDAKVVLVHGENGAGKTSLLTSIELALTGQVQSLERADPNYARQLLHRSASSGSVVLTAGSGASSSTFEAQLVASGAQSITSLSSTSAAFFRERSFLPQSLLGQLLQIYQDAGSDASSPLAQFVGKLLGLDRLDALEAGLKPLGDIRNVRKIVDGWAAAETEKVRLERLLADQQKTYEALKQQIASELGELNSLCEELGLPTDVTLESLNEVRVLLADDADTRAFAQLLDQRRLLGSIRREIDLARQSSLLPPIVPSIDLGVATQAYAAWETTHGARVAGLRERVEMLLPTVSLPSGLAEFVDGALIHLRTEEKQLSERTSAARADARRLATARDEWEVALKQRDTLDQEVALLSSDAGSLSSTLAEMASFIRNDTCPVCDRDFAEEKKGPLTEHVHGKVRFLSASAERLLTLGRTRSEAQVTLERLDREIETLTARRHDDREMADLDRRYALVRTLREELGSTEEIFRAGGRLRAEEVSAQRFVAEARSQNTALIASRETLNEFAIEIGANALQDNEIFEDAAARLDTTLLARVTRLESRLSSRRRGNERIDVVRTVAERLSGIEAQRAADNAAWKRAEGALQKAQVLREQGNSVRMAVDHVRSAIIRREFNDRLNRVWRDLFIRLAPSEPFVPAFRIPASSTQKLQPKLITEHRDGGDAGGAPGAMLSAGNLNTAALTLFIALHLSVPVELPWLILDDPVQSMDDVHIAHFAALLRTLSKEHGRQVMIAVHDRQLFEYLKLELSPAFPEDSLLTIELSRGPRRDTTCVPTRFAFREETALLAAA